MGPLTTPGPQVPHHLNPALCKIINVYKSPRSQFTSMAIPTFPHPTLYVDDFNCQHVNGVTTKHLLTVGAWTPGWATSNNLGLLYDPKETASFFSHWWNVGTNPDLAFTSFGQDSRLPDIRVQGKLPQSQHRPSLITPPRLKDPAHSDPGKRLNFRKADWKHFCILTGESVPILAGIQPAELHRRGATLSLRRRAMEPGHLLHSALTRPSGAAERRLKSRHPYPYYLGCNRKSGSDGRKLLIPSTSRTLAARLGKPSTNLLASLDAPLACAPFRQTPSPHNSWRTGHTGPGAASTPGSSTSSCPTYGRFHRLRVTVYLNPLGRRSLLLPSDAWSQESLRDWIPCSQSLYSTPGRLSNLGFATYSLSACATSKFHRSGEEN